VPTHPPVAAPARLLIPRIEVDAPVIELGLTASRAVEDPPGPDVVGWYRLGPRPGEAGNSFITGHVDWKTRTAVFWRLRELQAGDEITVVAADGQRYVFVVEETGSYPAASLKVEQVMGYTVGTVLTLFTCAGTFDQATQDYDHRLVVRARER
jgi:LPXTG-site transpeptidase (sortase) family protein